MSRYHHKGAANQMRRPKYATMNLLTSWIGPGTISGFYDILQTGGALDQLDQPIAGVTGDEIWSCPNLLAADGGTGNTLVFTTLGKAPSPTNLQQHLTWRKGVRLSNGLLSNPKIPFAYYPENFINDIFTQTQNNGDTPDNDLLRQIVVMGYLTDSVQGLTDPLPSNFTGMTYGIFGCQALYESQLFMTQLSPTGGDTMFANFPAPVMPGSVIYEIKPVNNLDGTISMRVRIWIQNVLMHDETTAAMVSGIPVTDITQLLGQELFSQMGMLFGLFCFATQKLFYINKLLSDVEREELHSALIGTSEYYGHG